MSAPVTSVNGMTGAVTISSVSTATTTPNVAVAWLGGVTNEVVQIHLEYTKGVWNMRIDTPSYHNLTPKHIMSAKNTFDNALKLYDEVKDFDLSDLPTN